MQHGTSSPSRKSSPPSGSRHKAQAQGPNGTSDCIVAVHCTSRLFEVELGEVYLRTARSRLMFDGWLMGSVGSCRARALGEGLGYLPR